MYPHHSALSDPGRNKAVADGAVCFFLEHFVSARVMKMTYGTDVYVTYDANNPEHYARRKELYTRPSGKIVLPKGFSSILEKVCILFTRVRR